MSGGSWEYLFGRIDDAADQLIHSREPLRRAFGRHLKLCAKALHDIEWVDSWDYSSGDELDAIRAALGKDATHAEREAALADARRDAERLRAALRNCRLLANRRLRKPEPTKGAPGDWSSVLRFCDEADVRDEILREAAALAPPAEETKP